MQQIGVEWEQRLQLLSFSPPAILESSAKLIPIPLPVHPHAQALPTLHPCCWRACLTLCSSALFAADFDQDIRRF
jgi:hypothetical protein